MSALRVGVIGANSKSGWARESHIPAIQGLAGLELAAVATRTRETADAASNAFHVPAYDNGLELASASDIDVVVVATRVPDHSEMVLAALASGKHVYCEWPLGRGVDETSELCISADASKLHTAIGLQLRGSPTVVHANRLLDDGALGRVLSANVYATTAGFGLSVPEPYLYLEDPENFANLITIQAAHTLDLAAVLLGKLDTFDALASRQYETIEAGLNKEIRQRETYDHLLLQGTTENGYPVAIEVAGGRPPETPFHLEIVGDKGTMKLHGGAPRGFQSNRLSLQLNGKDERIDEGELSALPSAAVNVGGIYAALRDDIRNSTSFVAGFSEALNLTELVEAVLKTRDLKSA